MENYENDEAIEKQKEIFYQIVWSCLRDYPQTRLRPLPVMIAQGKHVDLFEVSTRVRDLGGFDAVTQKKLWPSIASESLGLDPSCGAALKLVFLKYLKQPQKWLQRGCTSRARGSIVDGPVQDSRAERKKASKRRRDSLAEMLESLRFVAKNAGSELKGAWLEECVPRALKARALLFGSSGNFALKVEFHPNFMAVEFEFESEPCDLEGMYQKHVPCCPPSPSSKCHGAYEQTLEVR
ncbi:AT-rich interactive domain-containing protein 1-like [Cryptomeria japonica]|uniref:AT-rich interactive domain-containing protein 1-like n=1 Tax=Cryptomeria japonica TaxID=3369 RepID=UPI0027D9D13F|nr:AT-rich interactive domain-containing protein 1-like [Cryptomeria japonica]